MGSPGHDRAVPEVIASIMPRSVGHGRRMARRAAMAGAGWIELRLDEWPLGESLEPMIGAIQLPVLVTIRTPRDAGSFRGSLADRRSLFEHAIESGAAAIDLEDWERWSPGAVQPRLLMRSYHDFTGPGDGVELRSIRDGLLDRGCNWTKIVVTAPDLADAAGVLDLVAASDPAQEPTIGFAMGERAWPSRVLACLYGAPLCYGAVSRDEATAAGQVGVAELTGIYDVRRLGIGTAVYGLIGNPARNSLGPWLHNRAFRRLGVDAIYLPFETSRPRELLAMLPRRRLGGLSVTAPFKAELAQYCHELAQTAIAAGVINTLTFAAHGRVVGHNTDIVGVQTALLDAGLTNLASDRSVHTGAPAAAVLGTGGAARAAAIALQQLGYSVTFLGRSLESIRAFARDRSMALARLDAAVLRELRPAVVVQATPVGSTGRDDAPLLGDWRPERGVFVHDLVYRPQQTEFLERARESGATAVNGLGMFLTQAAEQVALFADGQRLAEDELEEFLCGIPQPDVQTVV